MTTTDRLAALATRLGRCSDPETAVVTALDGLAEDFGFTHSIFLLVDEARRSLSTLAVHGYDQEAVGAELAMGDGLIGMAAERGEPVRVGNLRSMLHYGRTVRRSFEEGGTAAVSRDLPLPGLPDAGSQLVVPAVTLGRLVGVLSVEDTEQMAFDTEDEAVLSVTAGLVASTIAIDSARAQDADGPAPEVPAPRSTSGPSAADPVMVVRHFEVDGSTFLDGDYLIKGVAGRILWSVLRQHEADGRVDFTNRELRLDPALGLPPVKDNLESRLLLLRRRLTERRAPVALERTGRGRFRLALTAAVRLDAR